MVAYWPAFTRVERAVMTGPSRPGGLRRWRGQTLQMRKQYHFWPNERGGLDAWDVDRLIELSSDLPVLAVDVRSIAEIDTVYWFDGDLEVPTVRRIVDHVRLIMDVDPSFPIVLGYDGRVMDGMHRVARAMLEGRPAISAVQFVTHPAPDFPNCRPSELPYDDQLRQG